MSKHVVFSAPKQGWKRHLPDERCQSKHPVEDTRQGGPFRQHIPLVGIESASPACAGRSPTRGLKTWVAWAKRTAQGLAKRTEVAQAEERAAKQSNW